MSTQRAKALRGEETPEAAEAALDQQKREAAQWGSSSSSNGSASDWVHVHPACTLLQVLTYAGYVVAGGSPVLYVYPKGSVLQQELIKRCGAKMRELKPQQQ